jgi:hypothetical protein
MKGVKVQAQKTPSIRPKNMRNARGMMKMNPHTTYMTVERSVVVTIMTLATVR